VPVVSAPGGSVPSRVCGSLVKAAGLEDMVRALPAEYGGRGMQLATDGNLIGALKAKLAEKRENCTLFDTGLLVSSLEQLYAQAWRDYITGTLPAPDLANLEIYHQIGCDLDHEGMEFQRLADYQGLYRRQLAARHALYPVPADHRLWGSAGPADNEPAELRVGPPASERQANGNAVNVAALTQQQLH